MTIERYYSPAMLTTGALALALLAAFMIGLSKTAIPGGGLLATPVVAVTFHGRGLPGATLGILLMADILAVRTYRHTARWDVLRPLVPWIVWSDFSPARCMSWHGRKSQTKSGMKHLRSRGMERS